MSTHDLTVIVNGHREGTLAHHTLRTLHRSLVHATAEGLSVEVIAVLDNADDATRAVFEEAAGPKGYLAQTATPRIVEVAFADLGEARNHGVSLATAPAIAVLDADNLPSENWFLEGHRTLVAHDGPCVVHPENLVIFEGRTVLWPQWPTADPRFRAENFYDQNYWDAACLASREVFRDHPYLPTPRGAGFGPEDWHWNTEVVHAGIPHLAAAGTALFYRAKTVGSLMGAHRTNRSLIHQTPLLTDPDRAHAVLAEATQAVRPHVPRRTRMLKRILRGKKRADTPPPAPLGTWGRLRARLDRDFVAPDHYRYLYDLPHWSDREVRAHYRSHGREEGRRRWLTQSELTALSPRFFRVDHYRVLNATAMHLTKAGARVHYLDVGRRRGLRARLTRDEIRALAKLDLDDYQSLHPDLSRHKDVELVQHYLEHGIRERRRTVLAAEERARPRRVEISDSLAAEWRAIHRFEPWVPVPTKETLASYQFVGPPYDGSLTPASAAWWQAIAALDGIRPDVLFVAPWVRMGGGDLLLARYAKAVADLRPDLAVVVVTTHGPSSHPELLDPAITFLDLPSIPAFAAGSKDVRARFVASLITQFRPSVVHAFNSPEAFDAVEHYPRAAAAHTRVFLSTFAIDYGPEGQIFSHLARRPSNYLDAVERVIVDNHSLVEDFHEIYRMDRAKFDVHHQPVELPPRRPRSSRRDGGPLRVLWAARFDRQKRLDLLADVAESARTAGLDVEWHVYGAPVIDAGTQSEGPISRLKEVGAHFHGTYRSLDEVPLDDFDLFLLTSENEGIPLTLLDIMARRLPVMAPLVGGIPELIGPDTGWPIRRFDDVDSYVEALQQVALDPAEAQRRADAGYELLAEDFSWEAFHRRLAETPGYLP